MVETLRQRWIRMGYNGVYIWKCHKNLSFCMCSNLVSVAAIKHQGQKQPRGGKGLCFLHLQFTAHYCGSQDRTPAGTEAETLEEAACWLTHRLMFSLLSYSTGPPTQRIVPPTVGWALLHQFTIKKIHQWHVLKIIWGMQFLHEGFLLWLLLTDQDDD